MGRRPVKQLIIVVGVMVVVAVVVVVAMVWVIVYIEMNYVALVVIRIAMSELWTVYTVYVCVCYSQLILALHVFFSLA